MAGIQRIQGQWSKEGKPGFQVCGVLHEETRQGCLLVPSTLLRPARQAYQGSPCHADWIRPVFPAIHMSSSGPSKPKPVSLSNISHGQALCCDLVDRPARRNPPVHLGSDSVRVPTVNC